MINSFESFLDSLRSKALKQEQELSELRSSYDTLVRLYNSELRQYQACVAAYRKLTSILLELPDFKEKWDKFHEAPDYDRR